MLPARKAVRSRNKRRGEVAAAIGLDVCMIDLANALPAETHGMRSLGERGEGGGGRNEPKVLLCEEGKVP